MARNAQDGNSPSESDGPTLLDQLAKLALSLLVLLLLGYFLARGGNFAKSGPDQATRPAVLVDSRPSASSLESICGVADSSGRAVPVAMLYSEDKRGWLEYAASRFAKLCPNIQIKLQAMEDFSALSGMLAGDLHPIIWAPTDELAMRALADQAARMQRGSEFQIVKNQQLVRSPQVLLIWQDRLDVLSTVLRDTPSEEGQWVRGLCAGISHSPILGSLPREQMVPGSWLDFAAPLLGVPSPQRGRPPKLRPAGSEQLPSSEELAKWGIIKIGHAMPTRFMAGLSALYLLSYDYLLPPAERESMSPAARPTQPAQVAVPSDLLADAYARRFSEHKDSLRRWLRRCEAGLESEPRPIQELTEGLFAAGPARYDGIVTYENLTMPILDKLDATSGTLKRLVVVYPHPTLVANHPALLFRATPAQTAAAERWLQFLDSRELQHKAIEWGFRPGNPQYSVRDYAVEQNHFLRLRRFGVLPEPVLQEAPRPAGKLLSELIELWGDATERH